MNATVSGQFGETRLYGQGWAFSVLLHALAVGSVVVFLGDLKLAPQPEPFKWDVALVETPQPTPMEQPAPAQAKPVAAKPVPPTEARGEPKPPVEPRPAVPEPAPQPVQTVQVAQPVQPVKPVEQKVVQPEVRREVQEPKPVKPLVQEIPKPVPPAPPVETVQEKPKEKGIVQTATAYQAPSEPAVQAGPVSQAAPAHHEPPSVSHHSEPVAAAAPSVAPSAPAPAVAASQQSVEAPSPAPAHEPVVAKNITADLTTKEATQPIQEASVRNLSAQPASTAKADYGWLAKALWDRVAMLKRYPHAARVNHLEGRVVLRAVIQEDGHLKELQVAESSGHSVLDLDALEVVRRAMPLKLKQTLGRPHVVVLLPISYRLEQ